MGGWKGKGKEKGKRGWFKTSEDEKVNTLCYRRCEKLVLIFLTFRKSGFRTEDIGLLLSVLLP